ncbi:MAG: T9SS type A sorting domain-containing protein [Bacteroidetes bacterium]|nr:T9SS type A sorting domain-containing protein [Bacteroidota bacterium]
MRTKLAITLLAILISSNFLNTKAQSWEKINTGFNYILMGIEFPGGQSQIGFAGGESLTYMGDGIVIKTTNGGTTWTQLWTGSQQGIEGISFPDLNTGYIGGWSGYFAKTTNGGTSWTPQSPGSDIYYYTDVVFKDTDHGIVTAQTNSGAGVYYTGNGGTTWATATGVSGVPYGACHVTGSTYYLVTNGGDIQRSTNDGASWTTVYSAGGLLLGIDFFNDNIGIAAGEDGWIYKTYDGGTTWQSQQIAFGQPLWHDFAWETQNNVYAAGTPEFIYKSSDGGTTWNDDYPQSTYDPALYEILFTADGIGYVCGSQGWFYRKAPQVTAQFTSGNANICAGGTVQFTDQSTGSPTSWNWTFAGGTPSTSTLQNPIVTYQNPGVFDVSLTVTRGPASSTQSNPDMIHVDSPVTIAPTQPAGSSEICGLSTNNYTTTSVANAISYNWNVNPSSAGAFTGNSLTGTLTASNTWSGAFTIKVAGVSACGTGPWSATLAGNLHFQPNAYFLFSGGGYCPGESGYDVKLEDSDLGVTYELFRDGISTGTTLAGTGNELNFGPQVTGSYTIVGTAGQCTANMNGSCIIYQQNLPGSASVPTGPGEACNNSSGTYSATLPVDATSLSWSLNPADAGTVSLSNLQATVSWSPSFTGVASLSVAGENECGAGITSAPLSITVNPAPYPVVSGSLNVCANENEDYTTSNNTGSTYTWGVSGGSLVSGQGTDEVTVLWGNAGAGSIYVTETNTDQCTGSGQATTVAIQVCTGLPETDNNSLFVYPNPAKERICIIMNQVGAECREISLYSSSGKKVVSQSNWNAATDNMIILDVNHLTPGYYTLRLEMKNGSILHRKVMIS